MFTERDKNLIRIIPKKGNIFKPIEKDLIRIVCETLYNILLGNIKVSKKTLEKLKRHRRDIYKLCAKKTSLIARKNIINQKGKLLPLLLPILSLLL
jgi:hypothetical protein